MTKLKTIAAGIAAPAALVASFYLPANATASPSVAAGRASAIKTARSANVNKTIRNTIVAGAVAATGIVGVAVASGQPAPTPINATAVVKASRPDVDNIVADEVPTTTTTTASQPKPKPKTAAAAAAVPAPPVTVPDLTGASAPGKATNAPLVPGHWVQDANTGAIYRDPSPLTEQTAGANDPAYEAGLNAQLCMPGKPEFCQP